MSDFLDLFIDGRFVQGSLYEMQDKDWQGKPLTYKTGEKAGQPFKKCHIAIAIKKTPGVTHWAYEPWGKDIWAFGHAQFPKGEAQARTFAWKIEDGDSTEPKKNGAKNSDNPNIAGCWVVHAGQPERLPKVVSAHGDPLEQPGLVKCGYWGRLAVRIAGNEQFGANAGIYINPQFFVYMGIDKEISSGPNVKGLLAAAGQFQLPAHVQQAPVGAPAFGGTPLPGGGGPPPPMPSSISGQGAFAPSPSGSSPPPSSPPPPTPSSISGQGVAPPAVMVAPSPTFLAPPPPAAVPAPAMAAPTGPAMTAKANGLTYSQFIAQGWNDAQLRANGYMV